MAKNQHFTGLFCPKLLPFWVSYVNEQFKCPHYAKHQAPVSSENQNILKIKVGKIFRHYFISCQNQWVWMPKN